MDFPNNLRRIREEHNLLQGELAKMVNVSQTAVSSWERGRTEPNMGMLDKLCEVFDCSRSELLGVENKQTDFVIDTENMLTVIESLSVDQLKTMQRLITYKLAFEESKNNG